MLVMILGEFKSMRLSKDTVLLVYVCGGHVHVSVALVVPESSKAFGLYSFVCHESFKERMFRWELESKVHEAEDEALLDEVKKLSMVRR